MREREVKISLDSWECTVCINFYWEWQRVLLSSTIAWSCQPSSSQCQGILHKPLTKVATYLKDACDVRLTLSANQSE